MDDIDDNDENSSMISISSSMNKDENDDSF